MYIFIWNRRANIFLLSFSIFFLSSTITTLSSIFHSSNAAREQKQRWRKKYKVFGFKLLLFFSYIQCMSLRERETRSKREWTKMRDWLASCCKHFSRYYVTTNIRRLCESMKCEKKHTIEMNSSPNKFSSSWKWFMITFITAALVRFSNVSLREVTTNVNERQIINIYICEMQKRVW